MLAVETDRAGDVPHLLAGVAVVDLDQDPVGIAGGGQFRGPGKDALGAVADQVLLAVAGQGLAVAAVVGRQVTVAVAEDGVDDLAVFQERILQLGDAPVEIDCSGDVGKLCNLFRNNWPS